MQSFISVPSIALSAQERKLSHIPEKQWRSGTIVWEQKCVFDYFKETAEAVGAVIGNDLNILNNFQALASVSPGKGLVWAGRFGACFGSQRCRVSPGGIFTPWYSCRNIPE